MKWRDNLITFVLFAVLFLAVVAVIALFGGAVMKWFGFTYDSIGSIVLFFLLATLLSLPLSLLAEALPRVLLRGGGPRWAAMALYLVLDTAATALGLALVDVWLDSVAANGRAIAIVSFLLALWSARDVLPKSQKEPEEKGE